MAEPSETEDIFLHDENGILIAYHGGKEIARRTQNTQERFYADLHVWSRKNRYQGPYWRVLPTGELEKDNEIPLRVASAYENQPAS